MNDCQYAAWRSITVRSSSVMSRANVGRGATSLKTKVLMHRVYEPLLRVGAADRDEHAGSAETPGRELVDDHEPRFRLRPAPATRGGTGRYRDYWLVERPSAARRDSSTTSPPAGPALRSRPEDLVVALAA